MNCTTTSEGTTLVNIRLGDNPVFRQKQQGIPFAMAVEQGSLHHLANDWPLGHFRTKIAHPKIFLKQINKPHRPCHICSLMDGMPSSTNNSSPQTLNIAGFLHPSQTHLIHPVSHSPAGRFMANSR
jgi:hypothetical protein